MEKKIQYLFIHGAGCTKSKWRTLLPYFPENQVNVIDLPGRGSSEEDLVTTIEAHAEILSKQLEEETIVVGHSMGGLIGLELAARNEKVKGLVLLASFYELPVHPKLLESFDQGVFPDSIFYASYTKGIPPSLLETEKREKETADMQVVRTDFHACHQYRRGQDRLGQLRIPILALYGSDDRLLPKQLAEQLRAVNEGVEVHEIADQRHYLMLERPKEVSERILQFERDSVMTAANGKKG